MKQKLINLFVPFGQTTGKEISLLFGTQVLLFLLFLQSFNSPFLPSPAIVLENFGKLLISSEFLDNLFNSLFLMTKAMGIAIVLALLLSYLSILPFFKMIIKTLASFRYLTLTGTSYIFTLYSKDTDTLRTNLLLFSIIPFFLVAMLDVISKIKKEDIELCHTLRLPWWRIVWEVVIKGKLDAVIEVIRSNFAICWMMITAVEGIAFNLGGIGTLLIKCNKYVNINQILPILLSVLTIGIVTDAVLGWLKVTLFPYSKFKTV